MDIRSIMMVLFLALPLSGCLGQADSPGQADDAEEGLDTDPDEPRDPVTWHVDIRDGTFKGGSITIQAGDTVRWTDSDDGGHTVTADNGEFDSVGPTDDELGDLGVTTENRMPFEFTFDEVGAFPYHCSPHPDMRGKITVKERFNGTP